MLRKIESFELINGRQFFYNPEYDLFESEDGYALEYLPAMVRSYTEGPDGKLTSTPF